MALRQTTGFVECPLRLIGLDWEVPDFSTLSLRRRPHAENIPHRGAQGPLHLSIDCGCDWAALTDWWPECETLQEIADFLERLRADVPRAVVRNGMQASEDFVRPADAPPEWRGPAEMLHLGELAARIEGEPEPAPQGWFRERELLIRRLEALAAAEDVTTGSASLSRAAHAKNALQDLKSIDWCISTMVREIDPDGRNEDDRAWLIDFGLEVVALAFHAGSHARAAIGKHIEGHAVLGETRSFSTTLRSPPTRDEPARAR